MTLGPLEATTLALGEELAALFGFVVTRLTTPTSPETQHQYGVQTGDYDGNVIVTLSAGVLLVTVAAGMRFRVLSGAYAGAEALIASRDSNTQLTLQAPIPFGGVFSGESWEIVVDADANLAVESTLGFPASGVVVVEGIVYSYVSKTLSTFQGVKHDDGTGLEIDGVKQIHPPLTQVVDFSRSQNALDTYRRSFLVDFASGRDLDIVGKNVGVERPSEILSDDVYRALIKALAYSPAGTVYAIEQVLDALFAETIIATGSHSASSTGETVLLASGTFPVGIEGLRFRVKSGYLSERTIRIQERVGPTEITLKLPLEEDVTLVSWEIAQPNWVLFEDLVLGSLHHACTVFFHRLNDADSAAGKTYLDGELILPLSSDSQIDLQGLGVSLVGGVRLRDEGGQWVVAEGNAATCDGSNTVTGPPAAFPTTILPGDLIEVVNGPNKGARALIVARVDDQELTTGILPEFPHYASADGSFDAFTGAAWKIYREKSHVLLWKPSSESRPEYEGDSGTPTWEYVGTNEGTLVNVTSDSTHGEFLEIDPTTEVAAYRRELRITPESNAAVEILADFGDVPIDTGSSDWLQFAVVLADGERALAWGIRDDAGNSHGELAFIDASTGQALPGANIVPLSGVSGSKFDPNLNLIRLEKTGRGTVRLVRQAWQEDSNTTNWEIVDEQPYDAFPVVATWVGAAAWAATDREIAWGTLAAGFTNVSKVKWVDWFVKNHTDFSNLKGEGVETVAPDQIEDAGAPFLPTDVGKIVRISDFSVQNSAGGNCLGNWRVLARPDASHLQLVGETLYGGGFRVVNPMVLYTRAGMPFSWPDHRGHSIQILTGENAGIYPIVAILDPFTLEDLETTLPSSVVSEAAEWVSAEAIQIRVQSWAVLLDTAGGSPSLPDGFTVSDTECTYRIVPTFPNDLDVDYEIAGASTLDVNDLLSFRQTLPFNNKVVVVATSRIPSAYLLHERERNTLVSPGVYTLNPFYLYDAFGVVRRVLERVKAGGIKLDFDSLSQDAAGPHLE
jgi:hypothetical protein